MKAETGFTLIEVVIAVAISTLIIVGVQGALAASARAAEFERSGERALVRRSKALQILRADFRSRLRVRVEAPPKGTQGPPTVVLATAADSLGPDAERRSTSELRYVADASGLRRIEVRQGQSLEWRLTDRPSAFEFWNGTSWRATAGGPVQAIRLNLSNPQEEVVMR